MSFNGQIGGRRVAYVIHCARGAFSNITRKMFSGSKFLFFGFFFPLPAAMAAALNGALILTPLSKLLCRRFQRREIALASLIYVKTRFFFLPHPREKTLPETVFKFLPLLATFRRRRLGKPIQHVCRPRARATPST